MMKWARRVLDTFTGKDVSDAQQKLTDSSRWTKEEMEALVNQTKANRETAERGLKEFEEIVSILHGRD